jgi:hypothetical protein
MEVHLTAQAFLVGGAVAPSSAFSHRHCSVATIKSFLPNDRRVFYANHYAANDSFTLNAGLWRSLHTARNIDPHYAETTVNKLHSDWYTVNDTFVFEGYAKGTEASWTSNGPDADFVTYIQYMMQLVSGWTWEDWNDGLIVLSDALNPGNATAGDFDISSFYRKGRQAYSVPQLHGPVHCYGFFDIFL